jgi:dTDP-glucose pyrophosphorylase
LNIIVPMAGRGARFAERGVETPKPLIEVRGRPMVAWALESLGDLIPAATKIVFVVLREHEEHYNVSELLRSIVGATCEVVVIDEVTEGQLCTVLAGMPCVDPNEDVLVASCDTYVVSNIAHDIRNKPDDCHGIISVADMPGERWSFARTDETGRVVEVAEKVRISDHASTGLYYFSSASELTATAHEMIEREERTRGEYYVIPVYQKFIERGWRVDISVVTEMWDMGTPEAMQTFVSQARV